MNPTPTQLAYLDFIRKYIELHGTAPAEHEMQAFFMVSPPSVRRWAQEREASQLPVLIQEAPRETGGETGYDAVATSSRPGSQPARAIGLAC